MARSSIAYEVMMSLQDQYPDYWTLLSIVPDSSFNGDSCKALEILDCLAKRGQLREFREELEKRTERIRNASATGGNCHDITVALMNDLYDCNALVGWEQCNADVDFHGAGNYINHSWVQFDGYAIDNADGKCVALPMATYEAFARVTNLKKNS